MALCVVLFAMVVGVPLGLAAGYSSGWFAETIMRITDVFLAIPQLILAIAISQLISPSLENAMLALSLTYWPFFTRIVFAETRRLKGAMFIDALQCIGVGPVRIVLAHMLPNMLSPIIVRATIGMGFTILTAATLGFLGMGAPPRTRIGPRHCRKPRISAQGMVVCGVSRFGDLRHRLGFQPVW